jgi:enolase
MSIIIKIHARQIFDSENPTIEVDVVTEHGILGRAAVPSELQLENMKQWNYVMVESLFRKGVLNAVKNVNTIIAELLGTSVLNKNVIDQMMIDLDGTPNKSKRQMPF